MSRTGFASKDLSAKIEIDRLTTTIEQRNRWLNNSENKERSNYQMVASDTQRLRETLDFLTKQLNKTK